MAKHSSRSSLFDKLGQQGRKAFAAKKDAPVKHPTGGDLPAGIEGGVARLVQCKFDVYKKGPNNGELFFYAAGIVVEPVEVNGVHVQGLRTVIGPEPICDTPSKGEFKRARETMDEHLDWALNQLKLLAGEEAIAGIDPNNYGPELEAICEELVRPPAEGEDDQRPLFRFRTWGGGEWTGKDGQTRTGRVNHEWRGLYDGNLPAAEDDVDDRSGTETEEEEEPETEEPDLAELGEVADSDPSEPDEGSPAYEAQATLTGLADEAGLEPDKYDTWSELAEALTGKDEEQEEEEGEPEAEDWEPQVDECYHFLPKGKRKPIEVAVTAVFAGKQTCNIKDLDDGKILRAIPWSRLIRD